MRANRARLTNPSYRQRSVRREADTNAARALEVIGREADWPRDSGVLTSQELRGWAAGPDMRRYRSDAAEPDNEARCDVREIVEGRRWLCVPGRAGLAATLEERPDARASGAAHRQLRAAPDARFSH